MTQKKTYKKSCERIVKQGDCERVKCKDCPMYFGRGACERGEEAEYAKVWHEKNKPKSKLFAALTALQEACVEVCSDTTTQVTVHITSQGYSTEIHERTPGSLKRDGISMQNLKGKFIK